MIIIYKIFGIFILLSNYISSIKANGNKTILEQKTDCKNLLIPLHITLNTDSDSGVAQFNCSSTFANALLQTCNPPTIPDVLNLLSCSAVENLYHISNELPQLKTLLLSNVNCGHIGNILSKCGNFTQINILKSIGILNLITWESGSTAKDQQLFLTNIDTNVHIQIFRSLKITQQVLQLNAFCSSAFGGWFQHIKSLYKIQSSYYQYEIISSFKLSSIASSVSGRTTEDKLMFIQNIEINVLEEYVKSSSTADQYLMLGAMDEAFPLLLTEVKDTQQSQLLYMWDIYTFTNFISKVKSSTLLSIVSGIKTDIWITYSGYTSTQANVTTDLQMKNLEAMTPILTTYISVLTKEDKLKYLTVFDTSVFAVYFGKLEESMQTQMFECIGTSTFKDYMLFLKNDELLGQNQLLLFVKNINVESLVTFFVKYATLPETQIDFISCFSPDAAINIMNRLDKTQIMELRESTVQIGMSDYVSAQSAEDQSYLLEYFYTNSVGVIQDHYQVLPGSQLTILNVPQIQSILHSFPTAAFLKLTKEGGFAVSEKVIVSNMFICGYFLGYTYNMNSTQQKEFICQNDYSQLLTYKSPCQYVCNSKCLIE